MYNSLNNEDIYGCELTAEQVPERTLYFGSEMQIT